MPDIEKDQDLFYKEMGMVRIADGVYVMDLTGEARIPVDLALLHKLDELVIEVKRTNRYLATLTNSIE